MRSRFATENRQTTTTNKSLVQELLSSDGVLAHFENAERVGHVRLRAEQGLGRVVLLGRVDLVDDRERRGRVGRHGRRGRSGHRWRHVVRIRHVEVLTREDGSSRHRVQVQDVGGRRVPLERYFFNSVAILDLIVERTGRFHLVALN